MSESPLNDGCVGRVVTIPIASVRVVLSPVEAARFAAKIDYSGPCWIWTGAVNSRGYGCLIVQGKAWLAHRLVHEVILGPIPAGHQVDHLCRRRMCVNPLHLEAVTGRENNRRVRLLRESPEHFNKRMGLPVTARAVMAERVYGLDPELWPEWVHEFVAEEAAA